MHRSGRPLPELAIEWLSFPKGIVDRRGNAGSVGALYAVKYEDPPGASTPWGFLPVAKAGGDLLAGGEVKLLEYVRDVVVNRILGEGKL